MHPNRGHAEYLVIEGGFAERRRQDLAASLPHEGISLHRRPRHGKILPRRFAARLTALGSATPFPSPARMPTLVGSVAAPLPIKGRSPPPSSTRTRRSRCSTRRCSST